MTGVGVVGYGTIGKRVADAIACQPDMTVAGVAKTRPTAEARAAVERGFDCYLAGGAERRDFLDNGVPVAGRLDDLVQAADVVVDAAPSGIGAENRPLYERYETPAVFQGGEDADVADASFVACAAEESPLADRIAAADTLRVVSCNTTGLTRLLAPLEAAYGVAQARVTLVRRGGDPSQSDRGPINDVLPDPPTIPSHHGPDVTTVLPDVPIETVALKVPSTLMHVHSVNVTLEQPPDGLEPVRNLLGGQDRIARIPGGFDLESCARIREYADDSGRTRGDVWENALWAESLTLRDGELYCLQAIHQESDVVPENIDAVRALAPPGSDADCPPAESRRRTNEALGIGLPTLDRDLAATV